MSELNVFAFDTRAVRVVTMDGESWFVAKDVAEVLGYANPADAISKHCKGVAKRYPLSTTGGTQEVRIISEPDMLRLIIGSKLPAAERFERWVFEEVLPSIRRTGRYEAVAPDLGAPARLPQPSERIAAAGRIFNTLVRSGSAARMALPAAIRRAAAVAERETGVDMVAELGIAAHIEALEALALSGGGWNGKEPASPGYAGVARFYEGWADGSLGLPFSSCTTAQAYSAYVAWCKSAGASHTLRRELFTMAVQQCSRHRGRTAVVKAMRCGVGPSTPVVRMLLVSDPPVEAQGAWAGEVVKAFSAQLDGFLRAVG